MPDLSATECGIALTAIGGFIAAVAAVWIKIRQQGRTETAEDHARAVHGYEVLLSGQAKTIEQKEKVIDQLAGRVDELEEERAKCREDKATLTQEIKWLRDENAKLRGT